MQNNLLPLGTIFRTKDSHILIMIFGYYPISNQKDKYYRYYGVSYPIGITENMEVLKFNEEIIDEIVFLGFEDEKTVQHNQRLQKIVEINGLGTKILEKLQQDN